MNPASATANCDLGGGLLGFSVPQFLLYYGAGNDGNDDGDDCTCIS